MNNCLVEKVNISFGNVPGLKKIGCVTSVMKDLDFPDSHEITDELSLQVGWANGEKGYIKAVGECFFLNDHENHPLSYFRDITNSIGTEINDIEGTGSGYAVTKGISSRNGGFVVGNKGKITHYSSTGLYYDTFDLIGLESIKNIKLSNNHLENVDFAQVFDYTPSLEFFRAINSHPNINIAMFKKLPLLKAVFMNQLISTNSLGFGGNSVFYGITGNIEDLYECKQLTRFEAKQTAIHGDIYKLIINYRDNERTTGSIMIINIGGIGLTFNGVLPINREPNIVYWDSTHAYIAINTNNASTLAGKSRIYYIGYTAEEVATMKQGLWSGLSDANIIDCSDGGE